MDNELKSVIDNTLKMESEAIIEVLNSYDTEAVEKVFNAIREAKGNILVTGCGTSGEAAKKIVHMLACAERPAYFLNPAEALHGGLGAVQENDVVVMVTKGGETGELTVMLPALKIKKAIIIGVTENENSTLAKQSDIFLKIKISREPDDFNMLATSSITALLAMFDAITIAIMKKNNFTREQFALIHPGGAVGKRLTGKVLFEE